MEVGFVVPRYGLEVIGGSETAARMLAERLVATGDFTVQVFTTCGLDLSWRDWYAPGTSDLNGVAVHRFSSGPRSDDFATFPDNPVRFPLEEATTEQCAVWLAKQGPVCPGVIDAAERSSCEVVAFYPYLYYPTVYGVPRLGRRAVMHPAAHDEREIRLPIFRDVFASAAGFVFHTDSERNLVLSLFPVAHRPQIVLGLGIEAHPSDDEAATADMGFAPAERSYICCVGRVDNPKGTTRLAQMFIEYKKSHPGPLALVLVGAVVDEPPRHPDIVLTGQVGEGSKWAILRGSIGLVSPSANESFSLAAFEAWHAGVPVVVNGECEATREHCERSGGGMWFGGRGSVDASADLTRALERIESEGARSMAAAGKAYADRRFTWPVVVGRYAAFLRKMAERAQAAE